MRARTFFSAARGNSIASSRAPVFTLPTPNTVRMTSEMIARIDAWIAHQPGYVSRQDAIRHCVALILCPPTHERRIGSPSGATAQDTGGSDAVD